MPEDQMEEEMARRGIMSSDNELPALGGENETYAKLQLADVGNGAQIIYVKGTWYPTHFLMSVMDGYDTWVCNATQEFVAQEASRWGIEVDEWLDQMHAHFSQQHLQSKYVFMFVDPDVKMLECSFLDKTMEERLFVKLVFHKTTSCGSMAYDLLELLVDTNTKQYEELAQKTRDIQRLAAEIRKLRSNFKEHLKKEHETHSGGDQNVMECQQSEQAESSSAKLEPFELDNASTDQNTNFFNKNEESSSQYLEQNSDSIMGNSWNEEPNLGQQMFPDQSFVSNDGFALNDNEFESGQYEPVEAPQSFNEEHVEQDQLQFENKEQETFDFYHNPPNENEQQIVHTCSKHFDLDWNHNPKNINVLIAPLKITIEKKYIVDVDFKEQISFFKSSYKQVQQSMETNVDSNLPLTPHDSSPHGDQHLKSPTVEEPAEMKHDDDFVSEDEPQHEDVSFQMMPPLNFDRAKKRGSKVNFIPAPEEDEPKKTYYKTPKHSYVKSKMDANEYGVEEEMDREITPRSKSYVSNESSSNVKHSRRARKSAPSEYRLQESDFSSPSQTEERPQKRQHNNKKPAKSATFNLQNNTYSEIKNKESEMNDAEWNSSSSQKQSGLLSPNNPNGLDADSFHRSLPIVKMSENESNNDVCIQAPLHSILSRGQHNKQKEHIVWGEDLSGNAQGATCRQSHVANNQQHLFSNASTSTQELQESVPPIFVPSNTSMSQNSPHAAFVGQFNTSDISRFQGNAQTLGNEQRDEEEDVWRNYATNAQTTSKKPSKSYVSPTIHQRKNKPAKSFVGKVASFFQKPSNKKGPDDSVRNESVVGRNGSEDLMSINNTNEFHHYAQEQSFPSSKSSKSPSFVPNSTYLFQNSPNDNTTNGIRNQTSAQKSHGALSYSNPIKNKFGKSSERSMSYAHSSGFKAQKESKPSIVQSIVSLFRGAPSGSEKNNDTWGVSTNFKPMSARTQPFTTTQNSADEFSGPQVDFQQGNTEPSSGNPIGNEFIDHHQVMDSSKRASIEEVRRELSYKLGKQLEEQEHDSVYTPEVRYEKKTCVTQTRGRDSEPRRYSVDKIGADISQLKQKAQSTSESRESIYSNFLKSSSKSVGASSFAPTFLEEEEDEDEFDEREEHQDGFGRESNYNATIHETMHKSHSLSPRQEVEMNPHNRQPLKAHSTQTLIEYSLNNEKSTENSPSPINNQLNDTKVASQSHCYDCSNKSILCISKICFKNNDKALQCCKSITHDVPNSSNLGYKIDLTLNQNDPQRQE